MKIQLKNYTFEKDTELCYYNIAMPRGPLHNTKKKFKSMPTKPPQDRIYARRKEEKEKNKKKQANKSRKTMPNNR